MELGSHGVDAVAPGFVRTDMTLRGRGATDWQATEERFAARAMMGRVGEPQDVANALVFLASPQSGWTLTVDGGANGLHWTRLGSSAHLRRNARLRLSEQNCSDAQTTG
jgi:NAD(P)-dependent dehydrogenase (short-subunit alcohol dehydrogenase family)